MRRSNNFFTTALAALCLAIAACSGNSAGDSQPSASGTAKVAGVIKAAAESADSVAGTAIPAATEIIDGSENVWTVSSGVIYENGALAGYSKGVTLLLYDNDVIYQENAAGGWWSWNGSSWASSSDPRKLSSSSGTTIPSAAQITDVSGNVWAVSDGVIYENGKLAGYSKSVALLVYDNKVVYQENTAGGWWSWNGSSWGSSSDPRTSAASPSGTTIPTVTQIIDGSGNIWTVSSGVVYENGALAGYSNGVTKLVYDNGKVYQENAAGGWWSWSGGSWASTNDPVSASPPVVTTLTIGGSPPTADMVGESYNFVPATANPGGESLGFSITNMPAWASFSTVTGALTGTPTTAQAGTYSNVVISVSNGSTQASLAPFSITVGMGSANLSWAAPTENTDGSPVTDLAGYTIYYGTNSSAMTQTIQVSQPSATSYVVNNLGTGTYYFAVSAYSSAGTQSIRSSIGSKTIL
jgi:hypothetical protein